MYTLSEDQVRDKAKQILAFEDTETAQSGVGQLTSFKKLGFSGTGANNRPDGWYLPHQTSFPAIILEVKNEETELKQPQIDELLKNSTTEMTEEEIIEDDAEGGYFQQDGDD